MWVDTWRKKYRSQYPGCDYQLWTDKEVAELELRTHDLYDQERMYQCKADLLRLEVLWKEGGVYIDADMVWLHKDLQDVLDKAKVRLHDAWHTYRSVHDSRSTVSCNATP